MFLKQGSFKSREGRRQNDAAISAASHLCTLLGASTAAPCWTRASGGSPSPWSVAATVRRTREESAISTGKQVAMMTVGSGFAAPFFIARHQLLKKKIRMLNSSLSENEGCLRDAL